MKKRDNMLSLPHFDFPNCPGLCCEQSKQPKCTQLQDMPFISKSMKKEKFLLESAVCNLYSHMWQPWQNRLSFNNVK